MLLPSDLLQQFRHMCSASGTKGVVAAAAPEAALVGRDVLRAGGNAFDAAVATALAETVLVPSKCGLAGDLVAMSVAAGESPRVLVAIGTAPEHLASEVRSSGRLPAWGGLSVGVPAAPQGYCALAERGVLTFSDLAAPAIRLAEDGFRWSPVTERYARAALSAGKLINVQNSAFMPGGKPLKAGAWVQLPGLGRLLRRFVELGGALFASEVADALLQTVQAHGGVLLRDDLTNSTARWEAPDRLDCGQSVVWATPGPTHGPSLLHAAAVGGLSRCVSDQIGASQTAIERRSRGAGARDAGTSIVSAADAAGNAVVLVHSNSHPTFGSGLVVHDYDLILSNRAGRGFSSIPDHPNFPATGRQPITTLHAWGVTDGENNTHLGATSGGENQMPWNLQILGRLLDGVDPAHAVLAPLWFGPDSSGNYVMEEAAFDAELHDDMELSLARVPAWTAASGIQVVSRFSDRAHASVVSDPRGIGASVAA